MKRAAIFDLDGTLLRGASAERRLLAWLARRGSLKARAVVRSLARAATLPWRGASHALRRNKVYMAGLTVSAIAEDLDAFVESELAPAFNQFVLKEVTDARASGARLFLLTGAPDFIAREVSRRLALDDSLGTQLEVVGGTYTGRIQGPHWFGQTKVQGLARLASLWGFDPAASCGFADHDADVPFLSALGRPVAVDPHAGLRRTAVDRRWEILRSP